jgi:tRNA A-37 threonylcarbamoyl transferase component Bud32
MNLPIPEDFELATVEGLPGQCLFRKSLKAELIEAIRANPGLLTAPGAEMARGTARELETKAGSRIVVRRYVRGGFAAGIRGDLHWGCSRAARELAVSEEARRCGIRTPEVVGLRVEPVWGPFCRMDLLTRKVENACSLEDYLKSSPGLAERRSFGRRLAEFLRQMHDAGLVHADLHIRNILLERDHSGAVRDVVVLDLDRSRFVRPMNPALAAENLFRLSRSLEKFGVGLGLVSTGDRVRFLIAYQGTGQGERQDVRQWLKQCERQTLRHRLWWRLFGKQGQRAHPSTPSIPSMWRPYGKQGRTPPSIPSIPSVWRLFGKQGRRT